KSIPKTDSVYEIDLPRALEVLAMERAPRGAGAAALRTLGKHPHDGKDVTVHEGRYGPYVKHGSVNATLPKDTSPEAVTLEEALELIAARAAKGPAKKPARKAAAKPVAKEKTQAAATAGKSAGKKPAAKQPAARKASAKKPAA
ncbi:MAG: DNA topoisomerase I, partial [Thiobacillus sp.]|nr:DNA topoisomerase I [Thiobacillus sp.]